MYSQPESDECRRGPSAHAAAAPPPPPTRHRLAPCAFGLPAATATHSGLSSWCYCCTLSKSLQHWSGLRRLLPMLTAGGPHPRWACRARQPTHSQGHAGQAACYLPMPLLHPFTCCQPNCEPHWHASSMLHWASC